MSDQRQLTAMLIAAVAEAESIQDGLFPSMAILADMLEEEGDARAGELRRLAHGPAAGWLERTYGDAHANRIVNAPAVETIHVGARIMDDPQGVALCEEIDGHVNQLALRGVAAKSGAPGDIITVLLVESALPPTAVMRLLDITQLFPEICLCQPELYCSVDDLLIALNEDDLVNLVAGQRLQSIGQLRAGENAMLQSALRHASEKLAFAAERGGRYTRDDLLGNTAVTNVAVEMTLYALTHQRYLEGDNGARTNLGIVLGELQCGHEVFGIQAGNARHQLRRRHDGPWCPQRTRVLRAADVP